MNMYLELADLCVQGEGVEEHGADEGDVSGLAAAQINLLTLFSKVNIIHDLILD